MGLQKCPRCKGTFASKRNLVKYQRTVCGRQNTRTKKCNWQCPVSACGMTFYHASKLVQHAVLCHDGLNIKTRTHNFKSVADFENWKEAVENTTGYAYQKQRHVLSAEGRARYLHYVCQAQARLHDRRTTRRNVKGTVATGDPCISKMNVTVQKRGVRVHHIVTHSHELSDSNWKHQHQSRAVRRWVKTQLAVGVHPKVIFKKVTMSVSSLATRQGMSLWDRRTYMTQKQINQAAY